MFNIIKQDIDPTQKPIILYGCGKNGKTIYDACGELGWKILCFCDNNPDLQGKPYKDAMIHSIAEIQTMYPSESYFIYVTIISKAHELIKKLIDEGTFEERQFLNETELWYGKSCYDLCHGLVLEPDGLSCCCDGNGRPLHIISKIAKDAEETAQLFLKERERLIAQNQTDNAPCAGCPQFKEGYWPKYYVVRDINFADFHLCQFRCGYCNNSVHKMEEWKQNKYDSLTIARLIYKKYGNKAGPLRVLQGNGEITLNPHMPEIIDFAKEISSNFEVLTNAGSYSQKIAELLNNQPQIELNISLDAGTPDTFKEIKGISAFKQVVSNIKKYREKTENIVLKYIILPENINDDDINGFINICRLLDIKKIIISYNDNEDNSTINMNEVVIPAVKLAKGAIANNINVVYSSLIGKDNLAEIEALLKEHTS